VSPTSPPHWPVRERPLKSWKPRAATLKRRCRRAIATRTFFPDRLVPQPDRDPADSSGPNRPRIGMQYVDMTPELASAGLLLAANKPSRSIRSDGDPPRVLVFIRTRLCKSRRHLWGPGSLGGMRELLAVLPVRRLLHYCAIRLALFSSFQALMRSYRRVSDHGSKRRRLCVVLPQVILLPDASSKIVTGNGGCEGSQALLWNELKDRRRPG
jgi:hypothetical protein